MSTAIALRPDYDAGALRSSAKATKDAAQSRRLLALAEIYDGGTRTDAARIGGVELQTVRVRWRLRDLAWWVFAEFRITLDETTVSREVRRLGFRKLSARLQHSAQSWPSWRF